MRNVLIFLAISGLLVVCSGCTYWRQFTQPATWGMSLPELWQYEGVQFEKRKLDEALIKLTDVTTGSPIPGAHVTVIPRPSMHLIGRRPKTKHFETDLDGIVALEHLPSGAESWLSFGGLKSIPLAALLDDGQICTGDTCVQLLEQN